MSFTSRSAWGNCHILNSLGQTPRYHRVCWCESAVQGRLHTHFAGGCCSSRSQVPRGADSWWKVSHVSMPYIISMPQKELVKHSTWLHSFQTAWTGFLPFDFVVSPFSLSFFLLGRDTCEQTPVHIACFFGRVALSFFNTPMPRSWLLLWREFHCLSAFCQEEIVSKLLASRADVWTPEHWQMNCGCMIWKGVECHWEVQSLRLSLRTSVARPLGRPGYLSSAESWEIVWKMTGISVAGCRQAQLLHAGAADWQRDWKKRGAWAASRDWLIDQVITPPNHAISRSSRAIDIAMLGSDRRTLRQWGAWETGALVVYDLSCKISQTYTNIFLHGEDRLW